MPVFCCDKSHSIISEATDADLRILSPADQRQRLSAEELTIRVIKAAAPFRIRISESNQLPVLNLNMNRNLGMDVSDAILIAVLDKNIMQL